MLQSNGMQQDLKLALLFQICIFMHTPISTSDCSVQQLAPEAQCPRAKPPNASSFLAGQRIGCQWTSLASALSVLESDSRCGHTKSRCSPLIPWAKGQICQKSLQLAHPYHPCMEFCTFAILCHLMLTSSFLYWLLYWLYWLLLVSFDFFCFFFWLLPLPGTYAEQRSAQPIRWCCEQWQHGRDPPPQRPTMVECYGVMEFMDIRWYSSSEIYCRSKYGSIGSQRYWVGVDSSHWTRATLSPWNCSSNFLPNPRNTVWSLNHLPSLAKHMNT